MPRKQLHPSRSIRVRAAIYVLIILAAVISLPPVFTRLTVLAQGSSGATADKTDDAQPHAEFVRQLSLTTNDIIYNPADGMLYASVPSSAGASGNSIIPINPATGETGTPVFVGSEPDKLAMSDDGRTLYVALDGASAIRRFDTATRTAGQQFSIPRDAFYGNYYVNDLAVAPGNPNVVAVARHYRQVSPRGAGVVIFDNGVQRPKTGSGHSSGADYLAFSATESKLYGKGEYSSLQTMTIDASGVTLQGSASFSVNGLIKFANGLIYSAGAQVINPDTNTLLGTFPATSSSAFAIDAAAGRAYYLLREDYYSDAATLRVFDINTFVLIGSVKLPGIPQPWAMIRWGANGIAFRTEQTVYLIQTSLIPSSAPIPTPTPSVSPTPTPTPVEIPAVITKVDLPAKDLVLNAVTQTLYASVPSTAGGTRGNTITAVEAKTGVIGSSTFIGSEPGKLAISDDGQVIYAYLEGAKAVRRFDITTKTPGVQFPIVSGGMVDMQVVPGSQQSLAVSRGPNYSGESLAIYDNGVERPDTSDRKYSVDSIAFGETPSTLYGYKARYSEELMKFELNASSIERVDLMHHNLYHYNNELKFAGGRLYAAGGHVVDPEADAPVGRFNLRGQAADMVVDPVLGRAFFILSGVPSATGTTTVLSAYDLNTFLKVGSITLPDVSGTPNGLVRWGTNGLAFCVMGSRINSSDDPNRIYLIQSELVSNGEPIPSTLQFSTANYGISESSSLKTLITVTRTGGVTGAATVNYATGGGTATPNSDYTPVSGTLSFAEGETTKTFTVSLIDDNVYEGASTETIGLTLNEPSGNVVLGSQKTATLNIQESKGRPSIIPASMAVPEGDSGTTNAQFVVRLSHLSTETISVNYATADATANANSDYIAASGTLTFQPGEPEKTILLQIKGDTADEDNERFSINFSNAVNATLTPGNNVVTIADDDRSSIQFAASSFTASEGDGRATISVRRSGSTTKPATVDYLTLDNLADIPCDPTIRRPDGSLYPQGTAFARCDYATTLDTLRFAPGESEKTFTIPLVDDTHVEVQESAGLRLLAPVGATLDTRANAVLSITDNDAANTPNPVNEHAFFVRQHYLDFLSREPEAGEPWSGVLNRCANPFNFDAQSPSASCDRIIVSQSFFGAPEFRLKGFFVFNFYRVAFDRRPGYAEIIPDMSSVTGATATEVYAKRAALAVTFTQRAGFKARFDGLSNTAYVNALLDRYGLQQVTTPDPQQPEGGIKVTLTRAELIDRLGAAAGSAQALTRAQVLRAVVESDEVGAIEYMGAFVAMQYYGYLRRTPEESGYQAWLKVIKEDPNNIRIMVNGFMNSTEYKLRFGRL
jgi:hypothetical protein